MARAAPQIQEIVVSQKYETQEIEISRQVAEVPKYEGTYSVTPSTTEDITLATKQKLLTADVVVEKILYAEVSNNSGGTTATIGN
jgi:hypothetical protein